MHWDSIFCFMAYAACGQGNRLQRAVPYLPRRSRDAVVAGIAAVHRASGWASADRRSPRKAADKEDPCTMAAAQQHGRARRSIPQLKKRVPARSSETLSSPDRRGERKLRLQRRHWGLGDHDLPERAISLTRRIPSALTPARWTSGGSAAASNSILNRRAPRATAGPSPSPQFSGFRYATALCHCWPQGASRPRGP